MIRETTIIQSRKVAPDDIRFIQQVIEQNPSWHRTRLSKELSATWNWRAANGQLKDMACRSLLRKLDAAGHICLPPPRRSANNHLRNKTIPYVPHTASPLHADLKTIAPVQILLAKTSTHQKLFNCLLAQYHYLGYKGTTGQNLKYLIIDQNNTPLACMLFGSAAWKSAPRDSFIGWNIQTRKRNLQLITNNMRFLILPWVRVPCLASHILGRVAKRICTDWTDKYGHPVHLLETFVESDRFAGTCYKAANWIRLGQTKGRTRNDRHNRICAPVKDIYVYPLRKNFRQELSCGS